MPLIPAAAGTAEGEDEWETEEEVEIVDGEEEQENEELEGQAARDDGVNLSEVQLDVNGDSNNVLPLD